MDNYPKLTFKYGWDDRDEEETPMKGYRSDGIVHVSKRHKYPVYFIDPVRLKQDLDAESELGCSFLAEPGLIILPEVTLEAMENAVRQLYKKGYFNYLRTERETDLLQNLERRRRDRGKSPVASVSQ